MTFQLPLGSLPGRGIGLPINLNYNSKVWRLGFLQTRYWTANGKNSVAEAIYSEFATAGWTTTLNVPIVEWPKPLDLYWYTGKPYANGTVYPYTFRVARVFIHMPDGSNHELRKTDAVQQDTGSVDMVGTFYAVDGSRMRYDANGPTDGVLYLPDGSRYNISSSTVQYVDRNGNTLTYDAPSRQWTDTMNRTVGMPWPANPQAGIDYQYSVPGFNGNLITYVLKFQQLSAALSPNSPALQPVGDWYLPNPALPAGSYNTVNNPQPQSPSMFHSAYTDPDELNYSTYTQVIGRGQAGNTNFNPVVLTEVVLPNNQSYKFTYNNFGELDKIIYPSGAYQRYEYTQVPALGYPAVPYEQASRGLKNRWLSANGTGTDEIQWNYSFEGPSVIVLTAPGPTGTPNGLQTKTYLYNQPNPQNNFGYDDALNGMGYEQRVYAPAGEGGALLRRTLTKWDESGSTYNRPSPGTGTYTATRNARPTKTVSMWLDTGGDALSTTRILGYDTSYWWTVGLDQTTSSEYGFTLVDQTTAQSGSVDSIPQGSLFRSTNTTYTTSDVNYRNRNILGFPTFTSISGATGIVSQTSFNYDESAYPLITIGQVVGWSDPQTTYRGNPTTVSRWANYPTSAWIQTHSQYDQYGNLRKSWDGMGRLQASTEFDYSSSYYYAYTTTISTIAPDPSGTYGQPTSLAKTTVFDANTGLTTSTTDPNGQTTTYEYNDPLYRQTKVTRPDGGWTSTFYSDDPANTYVRTQTLQRTTPTQQVMDSYQYFDKLARAVRSFVNEGTTYLTTDTQYDLRGRVWRTSNPYRTNAPSLNSGINPSNQWTTNSYDSQNRITQVTSVDGAPATNSYGYSLIPGCLGTTITASDQMSRARRSVTDGFGRLIQVIEDPNSLGQQTNYTYDVLNNLRKVEQGNQERYFGYDSLSRVIFVRHVEQTVNPSLPAWTDPITGYAGGWSAAFTYDNNDNILTRRDARDVTTTFTYDQINRVTSVRYTNDPQNTPGGDTYYDGYRANVFTNIPNVKGQVWQTETTGQVRFTMDNFDVLGRPTIQRQQFWSNNAWSSSYQVSVTYDSAGSVINQTYPSGHSTTYSFDPAGRLTTFSGTLGDGVPRTYANNFQYNDFGGLQQEQFGTQTPLYHKQRFNSRGQLWDMRLSTLPFDTDPANGDRGSIVNYFSSNYSQGGSGTDNNGNILRQEIYVPGGPYFQQNYSYDNLNRLTSVSEKLNGTGSDSFKQVYTYDRWGNRSIDNSLSSANVPRPAYSVDTNTNRLIAPAGFNFGYDYAGNQTNDTYTGGGQRTFDAENHMLSAQEVTGSQSYKYSSSGLRVRRIVNGVEVWQVYGFGALLAEYAANAAAISPQKEYGYRSGQLLVTTSGAPPGMNGYANRRTITIDHTKIPNTDQSNFPILISGTYSYLATASNGGNVQNANGYDVIFTSDASCTTKLDHEIESYNASTGAVNYWVRMPSLSHTTDTTIYLCYGNSAISTDQSNKTGVWDSNFKAVYHLDDQMANTTVKDSSGNVSNGTNSANTSGKSVTGKFAQALTYNGTTDNTATNITQTSSFTWECWFKLTDWTIQSGSSNYSTLMAASYASGGALLMLWKDSGYMVQFAPDNAGGVTSGNNSIAPGTWHHAAYTRTGNSGTYALYLDGDLKGQVASGTTTTSSTVALGSRADFTSQALNGLLDESRFSNVARSADWIKSEYNNQNSPATFYSISAATSGTSDINWLVADQLGTPRFILDQTGALSGIKRHDYLPFGEEIGGPQVGLIGGRTGTIGYVPDGLRQKFTAYEFDAETGLNYAHARYQSSVQGRFTSVDPLGQSANTRDPQTFNRYTYVTNNPLQFVDPNGTSLEDMGVIQTTDEALARTLQGNANSQFEHEMNNTFAAERNLAITQTPYGDTSGGNYVTQNAASSDSSASSDAAYPNLSQSNSSCSITVSSIGAQQIVAQTPQGPVTNLGFSFNVEVKVFSDQIGRIGDPNASKEEKNEVNGDLKNGGKWIIGQWVYPRVDGETKLTNGQMRRLSTSPFSPRDVTSDDSPRPAARTVTAQSAKWFDSPGFKIAMPGSQVMWGRMSANFLVYAQNGSQRCAVRFHIDINYNLAGFSASMSAPK